MIQTSTLEKASVQMRILSQGQIETIVGAAFEIIEKVGCRMADAQARKLLQQNGCRVRDDLIRIPRHLVQQALGSAPKGFTIYDRQGRRAITLGGRKTYFGTSTGSTRTMDSLTGEVRPTVLSDIARGAFLADALPNIDFAMPMGSAQDVQPPMAEEIYEFEAMLTNTSKPLVLLSYSERAFELVYEMAAVVAGGWAELQDKPFLLSYPEPITPLVFPEGTTRRIVQVAGWGLPQVFGPVAQLGSTGPVTMAGALAQITAESLICLTLAQLAGPGAPCFLSANIATFDMKKGTISPAGPETNLGTAACAEIAHYFQLPSWGVAGATDAKTLDAQAGAESAFGIMAHALSGVSLVHDVGYMDGSMICSPEMLVLGDEVIGMVERFARGVVVNEEALQRELIAQVCPGGNYLQQSHTHERFRQELWMPDLMSRERYDAWRLNGGKDLRRRIREKIQSILGTHKVVSLPEPIQKSLEDLKQQADRELRDR